MTVALKACTCITCETGKTPQPVGNFGVNNSTPSGLAHYCKKCASKAAAAWKKAHPERAKAWRTAYVERNKARNQARRDAAVD
jgi:hypothetical protein